MPFITLEGPEGAGKTTQIFHLADYLHSLGKKVTVTREPGGTEFGQNLRNIVQDNSSHLSPLTLTLLFLSDRAHHIDTRIRPALEEGKWVLCDRFIDSTIAYQGYGLGLDIPTLENFCRLASCGINPDLTIVFKVPPKVGLARVRERAIQHGEPLSRFEQLPGDFHDRVSEGFIDLASKYPDRIELIEGSLPMAVVTQLMYNVVSDRFNLPKPLHQST